MGIDRAATLGSLLSAYFTASQAATVALGDMTASSTRQILATLEVESPMCARQLAAALRIAPPAVLHAAAMLEDKGLVTRVPDPTVLDGSLLQITDAGRAEAHAWRDRVVATLASGLTDLTDDDWAAFARTAELLRSIDPATLEAPAFEPGPSGPRAV